LILAAVAYADDWPAAQIQNVFSANGKHFVRIVPGQNWGDTVGFSGSPKGRNAKAEFYVQQRDRSFKPTAEVALQNPIAPVEAIVTDTGYLVTFDNWHNFGYGKVVAIYRPNGRLLRSFSLEEIYSADQLKRIPHSISSRGWRCSPHGFSDPKEQTTVYVFEHLGGTFQFNIQIGSVRYNPGQAACNPPRGPFSASWFAK
jgi:hypothetical protein